MIFDDDRYYTPEAVADSIIRDAAHLGTPRVCLDSTCGSGRLLVAASKRYGGLKCIGLDRDRGTILSLQKAQPTWLLSVADLLNVKSVRSSRVYLGADQVDLVAINPPFSQRMNRVVEVSYSGVAVKCGLAMAHVLRSVDLFNPSKGAILIVPESMMFSELDGAARALLEKRFRIEKLADLEANTFRGARAHATVIALTPGKAGLMKPSRKKTHYEVVNVRFVRGGLPVHEWTGKGSRRFLHTTNLRRIIEGHEEEVLPRARAINRGHVTGWTVLLPRVGNPDRRWTRPVRLLNVQLSDCVIALVCANLTVAKVVHKRIEENWNSLANLYHGTGARYVTVDSLKSWLSLISVDHE